ncbi:MAG: hypothetical protein COV36_01270 [Alphaproteobacteria bacterium CG11_big_fil_rev_8_21_14_0_20_44_7]|nr:MAG: hypothetical protein COV36_01270 [Alphaproteobacteria bacterium CG11_big_fil_rev_8_21_14_0_20_44_7]
MKVLFLCTLNAVRSPMAEYIGRKNFPKIEFFSAGVTQGPVDYMAISVMEEEGIDMSEHEPQSIEQLDESNFDLVVCLAGEAKELTQKFADNGIEVEFWETQSPAEAQGSRTMKMFIYRQIRDAIKAKIRQRFGNS